MFLEGELTLLRDDIVALLAAALRKAQKKGDLPKFDPPAVAVEHPKDASFGDYSSNVAMQSARLARMAPVKIAAAILRHLPQVDYLAGAEVVHPGFINIHLNESWLARQVAVVRRAGPTWGNLDKGQGRRVQVEYVSANPTGPLHFGGARNAVLGDTLANLLAAAGYRVQREYYVNDAGLQIRKFGESLLARYAQALGRDVPLPEEGYHGAYLQEWAAELVRADGEHYLQMPRAEAITALTEWGVQRTLRDMERDLGQLGVRFDRWFSEKSLYEDGAFGEVMNILRGRGLLREKDGAVWFTATALGGSKDEVIIRSNGTPGYFASDIAYHYDKFVRRGFDWVIDVWAVDHQGHVPRMKTALQALEIDPARLTVVLYDLVKLLRNGKEVKLSKRAGDMVTLAEVVSEVGKDAVRFMLLTRSNEATIDFDLALAVQESSENPVYYVQYAYARIASIFRKAAENGWQIDVEADLSLLVHPAELRLVRRLLMLPEVIDLTVARLQPHHLTYYARDLAAEFHQFYRDCQVLDRQNEALSQSRLQLAAAAKEVLGRVLALMGMNAPERM